MHLVYRAENKGFCLWTEGCNHTSAPTFLTGQLPSPMLLTVNYYTNQADIILSGIIKVPQICRYVVHGKYVHVAHVLGKIDMLTVFVNMLNFQEYQE